MVGIDPRVDNMRGHHGRRCSRAEGKQLERLELAERFVDGRQLVMRIDMRVAVTWKVLDAARHALRQTAAYPRAAQARYEVGIGAEAALRNHRIGRVVVHVE